MDQITIYKMKVNTQCSDKPTEKPNSTVPLRFLEHFKIFTDIHAQHDTEGLLFTETPLLVLCHVLPSCCASRNPSANGN